MTNPNATLNATQLNVDPANLLAALHVQLVLFSDAACKALSELNIEVGAESVDSIAESPTPAVDPAQAGYTTGAVTAFSSAETADLALTQHDLRISQVA